MYVIFVEIYKTQNYYSNFCVPQKIYRSSIIESIKQLIVLEERMISLRLEFAQIHKLHNYGKYKLHGSIINVLANIDQTQPLLSRLLKDELIIGIYLKHCLEYKFKYMPRYIRSNMTMMALKDLVNTPLYKKCNINICI